MRRSITTWMAMTALLSASPVFAAINVAVDIDSTRLSGTSTAGTITTQAGFTSWDMTNVGTSSTELELSGVKFQIFGLAAANQSRIRTAGGGGGTYNNVLTDFVYNEGANNRAVGLRITGLAIGTYSMQSWHYDSGVGGENYIQIEARNMGDSSSTIILVDQRPFGIEPALFSFDVTQENQIKEIIFREDDVATDTDPTDSNRARLNGFVLTPEPTSLALMALAAGGLAIRRRR